MTEDERIALLDKMVRRSVEARKESRRHIVSVMCFAPEEERVKLEGALSIIEDAMRNVALYHSKRKREIIKAE